MTGDLRQTRQGLAARARAGDHEAFSALVGDVLDRLYATARFIVHDPASAEDAVQEALIDAWRDLPQLRDLERIDGWLHRLLVRSCYRIAKGRRRRAVTEIPLAPVHDAPGPDAYRSIPERDQIGRAFERLTADQRTIVTLVYFADLRLADVAVALDIPLGTAKSRVFHAMEALRAALTADERIAAIPGGQPA